VGVFFVKGFGNPLKSPLFEKTGILKNLHLKSGGFKGAEGCFFKGFLVTP